VTTTLVTGATGFVGSACLRVLCSRQGDLHACARERPSDLPSSVTFHAIDLLDSAQAVALVESVRPSRLLHLAWIATPGSYWDSPENEEWAEQSQRLLEAFADQGGTRVVVAGTCAEYDWTAHPPYREVESPTGPTSAYGRAKDDLRRWAELYAIAREVSLTWARLFFIYGPHEHPSRLIPSVASALLEGRPAEIATGDDIRDYLHVEDASSALVALLDSELPGVVNVASGDGVTVWSIAMRIANAIGRPDLLTRSGGSSMPRVTEVVANTARLQHGVGWKPAIELDDGLRDTVAWWRNRLAI
jgi:nucleoside-diphosphate-sugar epimerase